MTVVGAVVLMIGYVYFYTGGMTSVADDFLVAVTAEDYNAANQQLSSFTISDAPIIYSYLKKNAMNEVKSTSWHSRNFVNNKGSIAGEVHNKQGVSIPTRMDFVKQDNDWKIYAISKQSPKATLKPSEPTRQQQEQLVSHSMAQFMQAAKLKSMKTFHQFIADIWQSQITVDELDKSFASIYNFKGDYAMFTKIKPVIESATVEEDNILVINGYFPLNTNKIVINHEYIFEASQWQLTAFRYKDAKM